MMFHTYLIPAHLLVFTSSASTDTYMYTDSLLIMTYLITPVCQYFYIHAYRLMWIHLYWSFALHLRVAISGAKVPCLVLGSDLAPQMQLEARSVSTRFPTVFHSHSLQADGSGRSCSPRIKCWVKTPLSSPMWFCACKTWPQTSQVFYLRRSGSTA